jgi:phosphoglycolate phosphatase-like HAD superfamily hydrolase
MELRRVVLTARTSRFANRLQKAVLVIFLLCGFLSTASARQPLRVVDLQGYLLSWNAGPTKSRIVSYVDSITDPAGKDFVPLEERKAFFDMDGTILCEKPEYIEVVLTRQRMLEKAKHDPELQTQPLYKAVLANDAAYLQDHVKEAIAEAFAGETLDFFIRYCRNFMLNQTHPRIGRPYVELFYAPMIELIDYLEDHGVAVYVVSTSQQEFIRSISRDFLRIPAERIIGTMVGFKLQPSGTNGKPRFIRTHDYFSPYNADENKVVRIRERGLLPGIFAFGNSGGDLAMLQAVSSGNLPNLVCILDHDDPEREYEYHKPDLLHLAEQNGWLIVKMKRDFKTVFREE